MRPVLLLGALLILVLGVWLAIAGEQTDVAGDAGRTQTDEGVAEGPMLRGAPHPTLEGTGDATTTDAEPSDAGSEEAGSTSVGTTYTLRGVVLDAELQPLAVRIELSAIAGGSRRFVASDLKGRFAIPSLRPGRYSVLARPDHTTVHQPKRLEVNVDADTDMAFVLQPYPYVDLLFVDAATGFGPRTTEMQIVIEQNGKANVRRNIMTSTLLPEEAAPYRYRWFRHRVDLSVVERLQVRALGYEPSAWIAAPTQPQSDPIRVPLRPDPSSIATLVLVPRMDTGEAIPRLTVWQIEGDGRTGQSHDLPEDGEVTLTLNPGAHRIGLGDWGKLRHDPRSWCVPQEFDVTLERGETQMRIVAVRQGGFAKVRGFDSFYTVVYASADGGPASTFDTWAEEDDNESFLAIGPLPPGTWTYTVSDDDDTLLATGEVVIIAGEIVDSTPTVRSDPDDDDE